VRAIRKAGYAFSEEEIDIGVRALAAPIFDHEGKIAAALLFLDPLKESMTRRRKRS